MNDDDDGYFNRTIRIMQKLNDDCFYFLTASCAKGPACTYRHNPLALTSNTMCPAWRRGSCVDPSCTLRHSAVQRPATTNGMTCFYENTPMGCLKPDCTFVHFRPRSNLRTPPAARSSATNLINKETIRSSTVPNSPPTEPVQSAPVNPPPTEPSPTPEVPVPATKTEIPPPRAAILVENKPKEVIANTVIPTRSENTRAVPPPVTGSRNVVIGETASVSSRTVVHRVVVSSDAKNALKNVNNADDSDIDLDDLVEQENDSKKMNGPIDISFPCAAPSMTNRLFASAKQSPPANSTKPIRLNRDRLPATNPPISNPTNSSASPSNGEKTSAGTELSQEDDRRTSRMERFKKQRTSPPRSVVDATRNAIHSKRQAPEQTIDESPPAKRLSSHQGNHHQHHSNTTIGDLCSPPSNTRRPYERHHRRRRSSSSPSLSPSPPLRKSPIRSNYTSPSSMNDTAWKKEVDEFLAKTAQPKAPMPAMPMQPRPMPLLSLRPPYMPPRVQPFAPRHPVPSPRPRQPSAMVNKRPAAPVIPPPPKPMTPAVSNDIPAPKTPPKDQENPLLELDESSDVVDTFALIDEALFGVDDLLDQM